ncbi:MAG TPA: PP2C family serine/threonine-protein phosphatase [Candidatus Saccharimonadales bacterium]|nr:PP2C family serine/threonine-protein phosphatase [Candidatus Saccharimonadales bacterium]
MPELALDITGRSELGLVRGNIEDSWQGCARMAIVADGVGGRPAGELASLLAVQVFCETTRGGIAPTEAVRVASRVVAAVSLSNPLFTGMCTTLTAVMLDCREIHLVHVGDSQAWTVVGDEVTLITDEQSVAAALVRAGELSAEDALRDHRRHMLAQVIGSKVEPQPQETRLPAHLGDRIVLATDGLNEADPGDVARLLAKALPAQDLVDQLVAATYDAGAPDNVTVVVADVVNGD